MKRMTDFDSTRESAWAAVMRPVPFSPIMKISLGDEGYACQSKNAPAASYFLDYGVYINENEQHARHTYTIIPLAGDRERDEGWAILPTGFAGTRRRS